MTDTSAQESTTPAEPASNEEDEAETAGDDIADQGGEADNVGADILPDEGQANAPRRSTRTSRPPGESGRRKAALLTQAATHSQPASFPNPTPTPRLPNK